MIYKKSFGLLAAVAVVAAAGCSYQQNKQSEGLSELALDQSVFGLALLDERFFTTSRDDDHPVVLY